VIGSWFFARLLGQAEFSQPSCFDIPRSASELGIVFGRFYRRLLDTLEHIFGILAISRDDHLTPPAKLSRFANKL
jgi:hypothetical protein